MLRLRRPAGGRGDRSPASARRAARGGGGHDGFMRRTDGRATRPGGPVATWRRAAVRGTPGVEGTTPSTRESNGGRRAGAGDAGAGPRPCPGGAHRTARSGRGPRRGGLVGGSSASPVNWTPGVARERRPAQRIVRALIEEVITADTSASEVLHIHWRDLQRKCGCRRRGQMNHAVEDVGLPCAAWPASAPTTSSRGLESERPAHRPGQPLDPRARGRVAAMNEIPCHSSAAARGRAEEAAGGHAARREPSLRLAIGGADLLGEHRRDGPCDQPAGRR